MLVRAQIISGILAVLFTLVVLKLIREKKLRESYSLLWFGVGLVGVVMSFSNSALARITAIFGATDTRSTVLFFSVFFIGLFILHFSVKISLLLEQNKNLTQELALLRKKIEELTGK